MNLKEKIEKFECFDEEEREEKKYFLDFIDTFDDVLTRNNRFGHFTASAFVLNQNMDKMLMVYHNILGGWIYPGGHADGEEDLLSVALREVEEETSLKAKVLNSNIYAINANPVKSHHRRGVYVPSHIHYDVVYIMQANDTLPLKYRSDESKGVKWVDLKDACSEEVVDYMRSVNEKLIKKLNKVH